MRGAALVVLGVLLAGCLSGGQPREPRAHAGPASLDPDALLPGLLPDGTRAPTSFAVSGCMARAAMFPFPREEFERVAPAGFEPEPFDPAGHFATLFVASHRCTFGGKESRDVLVNVPVRPPPGYARDGGGPHFLVLGGFFTNADFHALLSAWGFGEVVRPGDVDIQALDTPLSHASRSVARGSGQTVHLDTAAEGPASARPAGKGRVFGVHDRAIVGGWDSDVTAIQVFDRGQALLRVSGGGGAVPVVSAAGISFAIVSPYDATATYLAPGSLPSPTAKAPR